MPLDKVGVSRTLDVSKTVILTGDAVVGDVKAGKKFYKDNPAVQLTGTMPTVALAPGANAYPAGYHAGAASLTAVDGDLVVGNIKNGITIFGVLGTLTPGSLAEDVKGTAGSALTSVYSGGAYSTHQMEAGADLDLATETQTYDAVSMAVAVGFVLGRAQTASTLKLRLFMNGVQVVESAYMSNPAVTNYQLIATRALSGSKICKITCHNYSGSLRELLLASAVTTGNPVAAAIGVGSIKLV